MNAPILAWGLYNYKSFEAVNISEIWIALTVDRNFFFANYVYKTISAHKYILEYETKSVRKINRFLGCALGM